MSARFWVRVNVPAEQEASLPYRAYVGAPDLESRTPMPLPAVLVIDEEPDGCYLLGYAASGEFAGDTWHTSVEDAQEQASFAYGPYLDSWQSMPDGLDNQSAWVAWALERATPA
jgi:hypothetical protein